MELKNDDGDSPLMLAVRSNQLGVVDILCKKGCNLHTQGFDHIEPIDYAINKHNLFISDVLMKHEKQHLNSNSSINEGGNNVTAENFNKAVNNSQFSKFIEEEPASTNIKPNTSLTSLLHHEQDKHLKELKTKLDESTLFEAD